MKRKKTLGGLVVVAVLLSGTTVLYFGGVERPGVTPALAEHEISGGGGSGCPAGSFCAIGLGTGGGCASRECCAPGQTYCGSDQRRPPMFFQEIGSPQSPSRGSCWKYSSYEVVYCSLNECYSPAYVCPSSACFVNGNVAFLFQNEPVSAGGSCGVVAE